MVNKFAAHSYENDNVFFINLIDSIKGTGYCEKQWKETEIAKGRDEKDVEDEAQERNFWR